MIFYLDTSAINRLFDSRNLALFTAGISQKMSYIQVFLMS